MGINVTGKELYLRKITAEDITENVLSWFNDKDLMKFYTNSKIQITREILLTSIENGERNGNQFTYGIYHIEDQKLIGTIKLGPINFNHKTSDLVALIGDRNYLGKGLSVEAIKLGNKLAFQEFDIRKLYGGMYESNIPSIKAYRRAGWIVEGRLKGQFLVEKNSEDRILVGCFNPMYFSSNELEELKRYENRYI